jgi:tetratricopeptide (TPR) repeat protein
LISIKETSFWQNSAMLTGRALNTTKGNHIAYFLVGNLHVEQKSYDLAEQFYRKSLEYYPEFLDVRNNLTVLLEDTGRFDEAEALLLETHELYPNDAQLYYELARVAQHQGDEAKANTYYIKHANLLWQQGKIEEAIKAYDMILEQYPENVMVYHNKASALFFHDRLLEAVPLLEEALRLDPNYVPSQELLKSIQSELGTK